MKKVDRRNFLKLVGVGAGAAALAATPMGLMSEANRGTGSSRAAFSFSAVGPVPEESPSAFASLVLRGHVTEGERVSGMLNQRIVSGYPARSKGRAFERLGFSGRVDRVQNGAQVEFWGTVEDAADRPLLRDQPFHVTIDPGTRLVTYRLQGRAHQLALKDFSLL